MLRSIQLALITLCLLAPSFQMIAEAQSESLSAKSEVVDEGVDRIKGGRLYEKLKDVYRRNGKKAANREYDDMTKKEKKQLRTALSSGEIRIEQTNLRPPKGTKVYTVPTSAEQGSAATVCNDGETYTISNVLGPSNGTIVYYRFSQYIEWCGTPGRGITELRCSAWPHDTGWGWNFEDFVPSGEMCVTFSGGYGKDQMTMQSQARFKPCLPVGDLGCFPSETPWIRQRAESDGRRTVVDYGK